MSREPTDLLNRSNAHPNPMFDFLSGFMPRKLKDLFRWCEYLYYNSTHIYAAAQKLADYVITEISYRTESDEYQEKYQSLYEKHIKIKKVLKAVARDKIVYGNAFISVYVPNHRSYWCKHCKSTQALRGTSFKYDWKKMFFKVKCPEKNCGVTSTVKLHDLTEVPIKSPKHIRIIRWDPKLIDVSANPITGDTVYYYNIPGYVSSKVKNNDRLFIATMPTEFLEAIAREEIFEFTEGKLYHLKVDAPSGIDAQWGFPPLASTLKKFYYSAILRKANEAIALDFIVPFRVLHPQQGTASTDPVQTISLQNWIENTEKNYRRFRQDPLHIMFAPVPLGVSQIGGQGRALMTMGEVQQAEDDIIASMGVPREFLYGGLSFTGSSVTLRMLENQLINETHDLIEILNWIGKQVAVILGWEYVETDLVPFKFVDDVQQKNMEISVNQTTNHLSKTSQAEMFNRDLVQERKQQVEDALEDARQQMEINRRVAEIQNSMAEQAQQAQMASQGGGLGYDQQAVIAQADGIAQQLGQMPYEQRKSYLAQLQAEDLVMYSVVIQRWEAFQQQQQSGIAPEG